MSSHLHSTKARNGGAGVIVLVVCVFSCGCGHSATKPSVMVDNLSRDLTLTSCLVQPSATGEALDPFALQCREAQTDSPSPSVIEKKARALLDEGHAEGAVALLKQGIAEHPDVMVLKWLLARAYLDAGADFWALRILTTIAALTPDDCEPILWMAGIHLKQGLLDEARESLAQASCEEGSPAQTRKLLLLATLEQHEGREAQGRQYLSAARDAELIYEEDRVALARLTAGLDPGYAPVLTGKIDLALGWASSARAGSPADLAAQGAGASSPVGQLNTWLRFVWPTARLLRPSVEAEARALGYTADPVRDSSTFVVGARPGVLIGDGATNVLVAYHFDALLLRGGDRYEEGPLWFYNAHRAELEASLLPRLSLFGGAGRRGFRETGRSRTEADGGVGSSVLLHKHLRLLGALTGRWHDADNEAYDLLGGSALVSAELKLPKEWTLRAGALVSLDDYPHSEGYFSAGAKDSRRSDVLAKLSASGFSPTYRGLKVGATYEYAERFSTASLYDYRDHRLLLKLAFGFTADPRAPRATTPKGHVPLNQEVTSSGFEERLQDLLRQDEAAQRGSSCVE